MNGSNWHCNFYGCVFVGVGGGLVKWFYPKNADSFFVFFGLKKPVQKIGKS